MSNFSFTHSVFKMLLMQKRENKALFEKGLIFFSFRVDIAQKVRNKTHVECEKHYNSCYVNKPCQGLPGNFCDVNLRWLYWNYSKFRSTTNFRLFWKWVLLQIQGSKLGVASSKYATWKSNMLSRHTSGSKKLIPGISLCRRQLIFVQAYLSCWSATLTLYLIFQFCAVPIQQQVKIWYQKY